mmetsp:Transcript_96026/g.173249  ORF Transcript_96026/g.173249 Transcript_96026/m.173249 type:complete len:286 (+) Transcript_96026:430-1287(+)
MVKTSCDRASSTSSGSSRRTSPANWRQLPSCMTASITSCLSCRSSSPAYSSDSEFCRMAARTSSLSARSWHPACLSSLPSCLTADRTNSLSSQKLAGSRAKTCGACRIASATASRTCAALMFSKSKASMPKRRRAWVVILTSGTSGVSLKRTSRCLLGAGLRSLSRVSVMASWRDPSSSERKSTTCEICNEESKSLARRRASFRSCRVSSDPRLCSEKWWRRLLLSAHMIRRPKSEPDTDLSAGACCATSIDLARYCAFICTCRLGTGLIVAAPACGELGHQVIR